MPDDDQDGSAGGDHGLLLAAAAGEASIAGAEEGLGAAGVDGGSQANDRSGPAFNTMDYGNVVVGG